MDEYKKKYLADHKALKELSASCFIFLRRLDEIMKESKVDNKVGKQLAGLSNILEMANDRARYFNLGVNYRKDDKDKLWEKIKKKAG